MSDTIRTAHRARVRYAHGDDCEECRALGPAELESIVRALAAAPIDEGPDTWCRLCARDIQDHSGFCPWRRAREWVAAQRP